MTMQLFVKSIPNDMGLSDICNLFSGYGVVNDITIHQGRYGYGDYALVTMKNWFSQFSHMKQEICVGYTHYLRYLNVILPVAMYRPNTHKIKSNSYSHRLLYEPSFEKKTSSKREMSTSEKRMDLDIPVVVSSLVEQKHNPLSGSEQSFGVLHDADVVSSVASSNYKRRGGLVVDYKNGIYLVPPKQKKRRINWDMSMAKL